MQERKSTYEPSRGIYALKAHWHEDMLAGFSVAMVALPLEMGVALAAGLPPIAGLISAIIGGVFTTWYRGSHVAVNGPSKGLIVVIIIALSSLKDGTGNAYQYILAAFVISGLLQVLLGLFRMGRFADLFPPGVINGMLAAIGIIILGNQFHVALGQNSEATNSLVVLFDIPGSIRELNPAVTFIGITSLLILIFHPTVKSKFVHHIPAQIWVIIFALPCVYLFNFFEPHEYNFLGNAYALGPQYLIQLPKQLLDGITHPDFTILVSPMFWVAVISITLVGTIESVLSAKAVDKIDPHGRKTNFNKDLVGVGLSTIISGFIGGMPVITTIIKSSVNVNNKAQTTWSNFFHGIFLLLFLLSFSDIIQQIPQAALAAILVFTGYKLASPKMFRDTWRKGWEQLVILSSTLFFTLSFGLLWGIFLGVVVTILLHYLVLEVPLNVFVRYLRDPFMKSVSEKKNRHYFKIKGIANFVNILKLMKKIYRVPGGSHLIIDFSHTRLIDNTVLEKIYEYGDEYAAEGGRFEVIGLDIHKTSSDYPYALHILKAPKPDKIRLSRRQFDLKKIAFENGWGYNPEIEWDATDLRKFEFFRRRPIEYKKNIILGSYSKHNVKWEFCDITFDEGALIAKEVYHISIEVLSLPFFIPRFSLEKEVFMHKVLEMARNEDIDFEKHKRFSNIFLLRGPDESAIRNFFTEDLIEFFNKGDIYHLESNGNALLVFKNLRLASPTEVTKMIRFSEKLIRKFSDPKLKNK
jgi:carbonic anhydrase